MLKAHLAVYIPGAASLEGSTLRLPSAMAGLIQGLAPLVERLSVLAYDPPTSASENRDRVDFALEVPLHVEVVSLGEKGSIRDYWSRRRRIGRTVRRISGEWDVTLYRLPNRRLGLVSKPNRCPRVIGYTGGFTADVVRHEALPMWRRVVAQVASGVAERSVQRVHADSGLFFANGEELLERYRDGGTPAELLRTSSTSRADFYVDTERGNGEVLTVAIAGRLAVAKGVIDALEAFIEFQKTATRPTRLVVIGDGVERAALEARVKAAGIGDIVEFRGWVAAGSELLHELRCVDVLLHLSKAESMPRMVWEAMSQSVLVIATPVGSLPRVFEHRREVLFVPVDDVPAAANALSQIASDGALRRNLLQHSAEAVRDVNVEAICEDLVARIAARWPELDYRS